jgi:hypothetical protein
MANKYAIVGVLWIFVIIIITCIVISTRWLIPWGRRGRYPAVSPTSLKVAAACLAAGGAAVSAALALATYRTTLTVDSDIRQSPRYKISVMSLAIEGEVSEKWCRGYVSVISSETKKSLSQPAIVHHPMVCQVFLYGTVLADASACLTINAQTLVYHFSLHRPHLCVRHVPYPNLVSAVVNNLVALTLVFNLAVHGHDAPAYGT